MKAVFETKDFGKIEVDRDTGKVYFHRTNIQVDIAADSTFRDMWGQDFQVIWPVLPKYPDAVLQVNCPKEIGRVRPAH